jgi:charged multivesicular body protein 2A
MAIIVNKSNTNNKTKMGNVFGKDVPLKDVLRENKREINRAIRELEREKINLEREEKKLTIEIKKAAKENQMAAVKIMAKDLVRTRQHQAKFIEMRRYVP